MATTIAHYEAKFQQIKTQKLPPQVVIDDLGNTISAADYRRQKADFLALEVGRIAWSRDVLKRAKALVSAAQKYAQRQ